MFGITQRGQLTLGDLIDWLEKQAPEKEVRDGFGTPHSDRGDYSELAFEPVPSTTFGKMLEHAKSATVATFYGYKGGEYTMGRNTPVYIGEWGDSGEPISAITLAIWSGSDEALPTIAELKTERDRLREELAGVIEAADIAGYSTERGLLAQRIKQARAVLQESGDE